MKLRFRMLFFSLIAVSFIILHATPALMEGTTFTKYALSDDQLIRIARLCQQEQGSVAGAKAEASLMANQLETSQYRQNKYGTGADGLYNWVRNGGWFSRAAYWMDNGSVSSAVIEGVRDVLVNGNRTLPWYVDEHDCFSDISSISTGSVYDTSAYRQGQTVVTNTYGSTWTFWCFPTSGSDPFGYTAAAYNAVGGKMQPDPVINRGAEMATGYDRTIPDGDYIIAMASNPLYYLDIVGTNMPAQNGENVALCQAGSMDGIVGLDTWTVQYRGNGFYSIKQRGTNVSLDLYGASVDECANVGVYQSNDSSAQMWAISENGSNGYRIQAKCSGFSLDANGGIVNGANIQQYTGHSGDNQSWVFIPYIPSQPIENGRYIILSAMDQGFEVDIPGDTGSVDDRTNVRLWDIGALSQFNSFDITKLDNGYYKIIHAASGKSLDVNDGGSAYGQNIGLYGYHGGITEQWTIMPNGNGYVIRARSSGYSMDASSSTAVNDVNIHQWPFHGLANQTWYFVPAEYTVSYDANGGTGAPANQTKYWHKPDLILSSTIPTREGYTFLYWVSGSEGTGAIYNPGDSYSTDADQQLYAVWQQNGPRIELSTNEILLTQYSNAVELTATLYADETYSSNFIWDCIHVGDKVWDNSIYFRVNGNSAIIRAKERTGNYIVTCSTIDGEAVANCIVTVDPSPVTSLSLSQTSISMNAGEQHSLVVDIMPQYTTLKEVIWSSSNTDVVMVSSGDIYAVGEGTATVTCKSASDSSIEATCIVTVVVPVNAIILDKAIYEFSSISEGSITLSATISPENTTNKTMVWTSSDTDVATVSNGVVVPIRPGYTRVICASPEGPKGICDIVVHADNIVSLPGSLKSIHNKAFYGSSIQEVIIPDGTTFVGSKAFADCRQLTLISIPESVTEIASDAFSGSNKVAILCKEPCYATDYASSTGIPFILASMPQEVRIFAEAESLVIGKPMILTGQVIPYDAPGALKWSVIGGHNIASIQANGNICTLTARETGTVTIEATAINGMSGTVSILILDRPIKYSIMFDPNGGSCELEGREAAYDAAIGSLPIPTRDYCSFDGWYTEQDGGSKITDETVYDDYDDDELILYAHWTRLTCSVTYNANGGICSTASKDINCGEAIGDLPMPTRTYYSFSGWYSAATGGTKVTESTVFTTDTTIYAHWTLNDYGEWSAWSTIAVSGNDNRQVETKTEQVQTGTKTTYNYNRFLYYRPDYGYYMASYGSNWATSNGYSGSWQYLSSASQLPVDHQTDGQNVYLGEVRDGNKWWYNESVSTEPIYSNVTYYRYRDRIQ